MQHPSITDAQRHSLRAWVDQTGILPKFQERAEVRILASLVTAFFLVHTAEPIFYLFLVPASLVWRVGQLAPSIYCVAAAFVVAFLLTLPHMLALLLRPQSLHIAWPRKAAAAGAVLAAITWLYLANLALPLDVGAVEYAYGLRMVGSLLVGGTYAVSLNAQQIRECIHAESCE